MRLYVNVLLVLLEIHSLVVPLFHKVITSRIFTNDCLQKCETIFMSYFDFIISVPIPTDAPRNPCNPSPCGANAVCKERNGAGSCSCLPEYFGDPYTGCRPECVTNSDCDKARACLNNKCKDPCPGTCGINAVCRVINHAPSCSCLPGYSGNPLSSCQLEEPSTYT